MALTITSSGLRSLIQDYGRFGYQNFGISNGGPMDIHAFCWANKLLDNHYNAAQIEITFGGFSVAFEKTTTIALCGADLGAQINNKAITPWRTYFVTAGDTLKCSETRKGVIAYLAIQGGFHLKRQLSSCATVTREKIGGLMQNGLALQTGDRVAYSQNTQSISRKVPSRYIPHYKDTIQLSYIPNPAISYTMGENIRNQFETNSYQVSNRINRMGYSLEGKAIQFDTQDIISQGVSLGTIQLPKDGKPIVLMQDRQTMGGYPILGCVSQLDLKLLAQSTPSTTVTFRSIDIDDAESKLHKHLNFFVV